MKEADLHLLVGLHLSPLLLHVLLDRRADGAVAALALLMVLQQVATGQTPATLSRVNVSLISAT